jgi:hypothetical protein
VRAEGFLTYQEPQIREGVVYTLTEKPHGEGMKLNLFVPEPMANIEHATWDSTLQVFVHAQPTQAEAECRK